ncbi:flagellar hook-length control protein FliK [Virgibacillus ainsalahensis]
MKAIGMLFPQVQVPTTSSKNQTTKGGDSSVFQTLLNNETMPGTSLIPLLPENDKALAEEKVSSEFSDDNKNDEDILRNPTANNDDMSVNVEETTAEMQLQLLNMVIDAKRHVASGQSANGEINNQFNLNQFIQFVGSNGKMRAGNTDQTQAYKLMSKMVTRIETLVSQLNNQQNIQKDAPEILELLQKWTTLEKKSNNNQMNYLSSLKQERTYAETFLLDLLQSFQKREGLADRQQYSSDARVTSTDVAKWISNTLESHNHTAMDKAAGSQVPSGSVIPMSKVEQYVIHVNQSQGSREIDKQLLDQFQNIIKSSKFMALPNGANQLSITLRPENLGDMRVQIIQIQGEMTVKILVSTQAAKEMLESNIHQLRTMFSPQQVVVEKQEQNTQQGQDIQKESNEEQSTDHEQGQSQQSQQDEKQNQDDDFETQFYELLNEKV